MKKCNQQEYERNISYARLLTMKPPIFGPFPPQGRKDKLSRS